MNSHRVHVVIWEFISTKLCDLWDTYHYYCGESNFLFKCHVWRRVIAWVNKDFRLKIYQVVHVQEIQGWGYLFRMATSADISSTNYSVGVLMPEHQHCCLFTINLQFSFILTFYTWLNCCAWTQSYWSEPKWLKKSIIIRKS